MKTYTEEEVEKIARRALFAGELFGRNKEAKDLGKEAHFPTGEKFEQVTENFLEQEGIHNSLKLNKLYYRRDNIGTAKYTVSKHDGVQTHKDGSPFYDIAIFKNKKKLNQYISDLKKEGYKER